MRTYITALFFTVNILITHSYAASLAPGDLPGAISSCDNCIVIPASSVDLGYMSVFDMVRLDSYGVPTLSKLIRYNLSEPSALHSINNISGDAEITHTNYTGNIWLEAPTTLQGFNTQFNIFTDQITPTPEPYSYDLNNTWTFSLDLQATLDGSGATYGSGWPDYTYTGNLDIIDGMLLCIECAANVTLNLVGFGYTDLGDFVIRPDDNRALLLSYDDYWELRQTSRDFFVQAVPVPAALWLFISGLVSVSLFKRKSIN